MTKEEAIKILDDLSDYFLVMGRTLDESGHRDLAEKDIMKWNALRIAVDAMRKTESSSSGERKGDGWSTVSVDENAGAYDYPKNVCTYVGDKAVCTIVVDKDKGDLLGYLVNVLNIVDGVAR